MTSSRLERKQFVALLGVTVASLMTNMGLTECDYGWQRFAQAPH